MPPPVPEAPRPPGDPCPVRIFNGGTTRQGLEFLYCFQAGGGVISYCFQASCGVISGGFGTIFRADCVDSEYHVVC